MSFICEPFGPIYPLLGATVAKHRKLAKAGLTAMSIEHRRAYGGAVLDAIRGKQRQEMRRATPSHDVRCASGTNYSDGKSILEAVRKQQLAELHTPPPLPTYERDRVAALARAEKLLKAKYEAAMEQKRAAMMPLAQAA